MGLTGRTKTLLGDYFDAADLDRVRIVEVDPLPLPALFHRIVQWTGLEVPDSSLIAGITFDYVIAAREPMAAAMLFHELVHVVQFRLLGVGLFARLYTRRLLTSRRYEDIPLEQCAYQLEARFEMGFQPFSVEVEVAKRIVQGSF